MFGDVVTLVNRTKRVLNVRFDGKDADIQPGENPGFPRVAVPFAKAQNPLMGSENPYNPTSFQSLVGVKDTKDPITPIDNDPKNVQRVDRKKIVGRYNAKNTREVDAGGFSAYDAAVPQTENSIEFEQV
jgi:hypothetical protein